MSAPEPDAVPDRELWSRLRQADDLAFEEIFNRHSGAVYNHAFRRLADWDAAQDVTQRVFSQLWQRCLAGRVDRLRHDSARGVLLVMTRNVCSNEIRAHMRGLRLVEKVTHGAEVTTDDTEHWVESEATMRAINESLAGLPKGQRDVIEMVCWAELSVAETASALRISQGTVRSRLSRARSALVDSPAAALLHGREGRDETA